MMDKAKKAAATKSASNRAGGAEHTAKKVSAFKSDAFEAIHSAAAGLHSVGVIDKTTMREFDGTCLTAPNFNASDVQRIRNKYHVSQGVLARYMGIAKSTVAKWESSENTPSPMAQRLLKVIDDHGLDVIAR